MTGLARLARLLAWGELIAVVTLAVAFRFIGERLWVVTAGLYIPRIVWALPIVPIILLLWWRGPRRLLWTQTAAAAIVVFPLMGLRLGGARTPHGPSVRLLTWNVWFGWGGVEPMARTIAELGPDIVVFQAVGGRVPDAARTRLFPGWNVIHNGEFLLATRFPVRDVRSPRGLDEDLAQRVRHQAYTIETAAGTVDLVTVHPYSPRDSFDRLRDHEHYWSRVDPQRAPDPESAFERNADIRAWQLEQAVAEAKRARHPVLVAGDTNLPSLSWLYARELGGYRDAWDEVGLGFGYTFPTQKHLEWLRIDRVLGGNGVRFVRATVGPRAGSDHRPLLVEFEVAR